MNAMQPGAGSGRPTLTAADVMTKSPRSCDAGSPVSEAVRIFREADCGAVPVFQEGQVIGVLTDRDVALALADHDRALYSLPVAQITSPGFEAVSPETPIDAILARFGASGVRRLLVVDAQGALLGITGWADVARYASDAKIGRVVTRVVGSS